MSEGWISLHRELLEKPIWCLSTPEQKNVLIAILLMANHSEKEWEWEGKKFICKAGQCITSLDKIAKKSGKGISIQNVRTAISRFEKYGFLTNESTKQNRLITICNWDDYQHEYNSDNKQCNSQPTNDQQTVNNQLTTNNNDNNDNNEEKEISTIVDTKKKEEERKAEIERKKQEQKKKSDAAKAATRKRKELFYEELIPYVERYGKDMIRKFFEYWTEQNKSGTKMKYEIEKTWDLARRLGTWNNREPIGGKNLFSQQTTSTEEKLCKWSCDKIGLFREGTYEQYEGDVKRNHPLEVKFLGYVE